MPNLHDHKPARKTDFGIRLERLLRKRNMSQTDLAAILGYSKPAIHHWLYGTCEMRVSVFAEIVDVLQLTQKEIVYLLEVFWSDDDGPG